MEEKWQCQFQPVPRQITVGQKLNLFCEGETAVSLKQPLSVQFFEKQDQYRLHILKTLKQDNKSLLLEVVSYRTGDFEKPFLISDGEKGLRVEGLSFSVQSVLKKSKLALQPQGPFGPFQNPMPFWYWLSLSTCLLSLICILCIFAYRLGKQKTFEKKVFRRKKQQSPSKRFILGLRRQEEDSPDYLQKLEELFKTFLEEVFLIPCIQTTDREFMRLFKKQYNKTYKQSGQSLRQIFNEFDSLKGKTPERKSLVKLKKLCQNLVFLLDKTGAKK